MIHIRGAFLASCLFLVGCQDEPVRPCDLWTASAVVSGRVTNASGPIAGAPVDLRVAATGSCDGAGGWFLAKRDTTDAAGNYSAELGLGNSRGVRCVSVTEVASGASAQGEVEFTGGCDDLRPPGQAQVDLLVP